MLDQNTDRMWFVIGALVVGAGIILLANSLFPKMFDNITKSFNDVVTGGVNNVKTIEVHKSTSK